MRSCSMALCLLSTALGSYLAGALTWVVQVLSGKLSHGHPWLPNDLNKVRLLPCSLASGQLPASVGVPSLSRTP